MRRFMGLSLFLRYFMWSSGNPRGSAFVFWVLVVTRAVVLAPRSLSTQALLPLHGRVATRTSISSATWGICNTRLTPRSQ